MENNFTSTEHLRDSNGNVVMESTGRTIARMREKQRGRNFVNGVIITALALSTAVTGLLLGTTSRYANDLRAQLDTAKQQNQSTMSQQYGANTGTGSAGTGTNSTATGYSGNLDNGNASGSGTTNDGTANSGMTGGSGTGSGMTGNNGGTDRSWGGHRRNWRNFNNNNGIAPARLPSATNYSAGYFGSAGSGYSGTNSGGYGGSSSSGTTM